MKVQTRVLSVWQSLSRRERRIARIKAKNCSNAVLRDRCKVILSLSPAILPGELPATVVSARHKFTEQHTGLSSKGCPVWPMGARTTEKPRPMNSINPCF